MRETPGSKGRPALPRLVWTLAVMVVGGMFPSAASAGPILVIDATADPGINLLITFVPQSGIAAGSRRVAAHQSVVTTTQIRLSTALPVSWMVSVLKKGDVAANFSTRLVSDRSDYTIFVFPNEMSVVLDRGEWQLPAFDPDLYAVDVGFGIGDDIVQPAFAVHCRPGQRLGMVSGHYQIVRSDDDDESGMPIGPDAESWDIPSNTDSVLTFNARGRGTLGSLR